MSCIGDVTALKHLRTDNMKEVINKIYNSGEIPENFI